MRFAGSGLRPAHAPADGLGVGCQGVPDRAPRWPGRCPCSGLAAASAKRRPPAQHQPPWAQRQQPSSAARPPLCMPKHDHHHRSEDRPATQALCACARSATRCAGHVVVVTPQLRTAVGPPLLPRRQPGHAPAASPSNTSAQPAPACQRAACWLQSPGPRPRHTQRHQHHTRPLQSPVGVPPGLVVQLMRPTLPWRDLEIARRQRAHRQKHTPAQHHAARMPGGPGLDEVLRDTAQR